MPLTAKAATLSGATTVTAPTTIGPADVPISVSRRHKPKKPARCFGGARSVPRVMTMPVDNPLAKPKKIATANKLLKLVVNDNSDSANVKRIELGIAVARRPNLSIINPAG